MDTSPSISDVDRYFVFRRLLDSIFNILPVCILSLSFLLLPLWSIRHPWNASFHFSFLIVRQSVGLLGQGISLSLGRRYLHKHRQTYIPWVGFEPTIPVFERAKTVHALDRAATVIIRYSYNGGKFRCNIRGVFFRMVANTSSDVACFAE
jgi:hypothetical protein